MLQKLWVITSLSDTRHKKVVITGRTVGKSMYEAVRKPRFCARSVLNFNLKLGAVSKLNMKHFD